MSATDRHFRLRRKANKNRRRQFLSRSMAMETLDSKGFTMISENDLHDVE